ncbi:MAG: copper amine oxidase N-terminal domain-containing protein, partial [Clostridia bacterium]|nr:copper amine oxidase N-terminal domain-containing protein [Clostridia bacterium]
MKRRLFSVALCLTLLFALGGQVFAADIEESPAEETLMVDESELADILIEQESEQESPLPETEVAAEPPAEQQAVAAGPDILVNGVSIREQAAAAVYKQTTYISLRAMVTALLPDAQVSWEKDGALVQAAGLIVKARPGTTYLVANGRYLYVPDGIILDSGVTLVPVRVLAKAIGANVSWDAATGSILITGASAPIEPGDSYYKSDAVYWLSHIINAE